MTPQNTQSPTKATNLRTIIKCSTQESTGEVPMSPANAHAGSQTRRHSADYFWPSHSFMCLCEFSVCVFSVMKRWLCGMFDLNDFGIQWYRRLRNVIYRELIKIAETNITETKRTLPVPVSSREKNYLGNTLS